MNHTYFYFFFRFSFSTFVIYRIEKKNFFKDILILTWNTLSHEVINIVDKDIKMSLLK